jgi:hypothetical protein
MDFRNVNPSSVSFAKAGKKGETTASPRVQVQFPEAHCTVQTSQGVNTIKMRMTPSPAVEAFAKWVSEVEDVASLQMNGAEKSMTMFRGPNAYHVTMRAFQETLVYDASGKLSVGLQRAQRCILVAELGGTWWSEQSQRWGLRWRVKQVKFWEDPTEEEQAVETASDIGCVF